MRWAKWEQWLLLLGSVLAISAGAQTTARPLVIHAIDESKLTTLQGSVHPLAQPGSDRGAVPESFAAGRMLLLLNRPGERETALQQFLNEAHTRGSANYHQWLTPEQFGEEFGPADSDIHAVSGWLASLGLRVEKTSKSRQFLVFSGTAGQLRDAFHTEIHQYSIGGRAEFANASEIGIPQALAPVIRSISPLNSFYAEPNLEELGPATYSSGTGKATPHWTFPLSNGQTFYALAPEDFATQYDLTPLYNQGVNGTGQTIGIINESNIDLSLVRKYQELFGLSGPMPQVVVDGTDPGDITGADVEAYLDVEEAGAVAPGATVNLYISYASTIGDPLYQAALRAVEDNQAGVLSVSFGNCEGFMLESGNALWSALWEQAVAQGQTVLVSSGDSGSADCSSSDNRVAVTAGLGVNGLASTPWDVAVGGTDFYYSDYANGGASAATLWNQTSDANNGSLKAPLPEQVWDRAFGMNATGPFDPYNASGIPAAGGGGSACINSVESSDQASPLPFFCDLASGTLYGYAKPAWQNVPGVPADGVRDLPDVALFASNGLNFSAYPICANPGDCVADAAGDQTITLVGGTSAPTPAMAGIMALVNQKYGRQGQADYTLYPLSRQKPAAFHDVTLGSNNMPCVEGTPNCSLDTGGDGRYSLQNYSAGVGYDQASGLGSLDAAALVNNWNSVTFQGTTTALDISPTAAAHGNDVTFKADVKPSSGGGTPQGVVSIVTNSPTLLGASVGVLTLGSNGAASGNFTNLPGGTYQVWAEYGGDGTFSSSKSATQTVTISAVGGSLSLFGQNLQTLPGPGWYGYGFNPASPCSVMPNAYLSPILLPIQTGQTISPDVPIAAVAVNNATPTTYGTGTGTGTGNVLFTLDSATTTTASLNSLGYATWILPLSAAGTHTVTATYSGDASYAESTAPPFTFTVPQSETFLSVYPAANCSAPSTSSNLNCSFSAGDNLLVEVQILSYNCHPPTGTVAVTLGSLTQNVSLTEGGLYQAGEPVMMGEAVFNDLPAGTYQLSASYAGDANSLAATTTAAGTQFTVVAAARAAALLPTTTTASVNPTSILYAPKNMNGGTFFSATVAGGSGSTVPPTGVVTFFDDGAVLASVTLAPSGTNSSSGGPEWVYGEYLDIGSSQVAAIYSGDGVYKASSTVPITFSNAVQAPDFLLAAQLSQISVQAGSSGTVGFNLTAVAGFNGSVALSCAPSSSEITCSLNPTTVTVNGIVTASLTVEAAAQSAGPMRPDGQGPIRQRKWPVATGMLAIGFFIFTGKRMRRTLARSMLLSFVLLAALSLASCGGGGVGDGGGGGGGGGGNPPPAPTTYFVVVTATANSGIVHNTKIAVVVP